MESIEIPGTVTSIGEDAFGFCRALKQVKIPIALKDIAEDAFSASEAISSVIVYGDRRNENSLRRLKKHFPERAQITFSGKNGEADSERKKTTKKGAESSAGGAASRKKSASARRTATSKKAAGTSSGFDERVSFDLPENYKTELTVDDDGGRSLTISVNPDAEDEEENVQKGTFRINVYPADVDASQKSALDVVYEKGDDANIRKRFDSDPAAVLLVRTQNMQILGVTVFMHLISLVVQISDTENVWISSVRTGNIFELRDNGALDQLNLLWKSLSIHGKPVQAKRIEVADLLETLSVEDGTYSASALGFGEVTVIMTIMEGRIATVMPFGPNEAKEFGQLAMRRNSRLMISVMNICMDTLISLMVKNRNSFLILNSKLIRVSDIRHRA